MCKKEKYILMCAKCHHGQIVDLHDKEIKEDDFINCTNKECEIYDAISTFDPQLASIQ